MTTRFFLKSIRALRRDCPDMWEFAPSGSIRTTCDGVLCPLMALGKELGHPVKDKTLMSGAFLMGAHIGLSQYQILRIVIAADHTVGRKRRNLREWWMRRRLIRACGLARV